MQAVLHENYMHTSNIKVRPANIDDAQDIVSLFCENGSNPYGWSKDKWHHYYKDYPEGNTISFIATVNNLVVGHYGILSIKVGSEPAMLGLHAYVSSRCRGLAIISALMQQVDKVCMDFDIGLICGFANPNFTLIKERIFKWKTVCWLGFKKSITEHDIEEFRIKPFRFNYSSNWLQWRFGTIEPQYISLYVDVHGWHHKQLLKTTDLTDTNAIRESEGWSPNYSFPSSIPDFFSQPFSIKVYNKVLLKQGICDYKNWGLEMGDSDSFIYTPWK
jgi:hypothetical protein